MDSDSALPEGFAAAFATLDDDADSVRISADVFGDLVSASPGEPFGDDRTAVITFVDGEVPAHMSFTAKGLRNLSAQLAEIAGILDAERPLQVGDKVRSTATHEPYEVLAADGEWLWVMHAIRGRLTIHTSFLERVS